MDWTGQSTKLQVILVEVTARPLYICPLPELPDLPPLVSPEKVLISSFPLHPYSLSFRVRVPLNFFISGSLIAQLRILSVFLDRSWTSNS